MAVLIAVLTAISVIVAVSLKRYRRKNNENECISNLHRDNNDKLTAQPNEAYGIAGAHELTVQPSDSTEATCTVKPNIYDSEYSYVWRN